MIAISAQRLSPDGPSPALVQEVVRAFEAGLPRLNRLQRYYETRHDILARTRLNGLPNTRLPHAYPRYIAQVSASYLLGEPVTVSGPEPGTEALRRLLQQAGADSMDIELAIDQAVYGRGVSLTYLDRAGQPRVCALDPRTAFVVYDDTVAREPLFGVHLHGQPGERAATVYTAGCICTCQLQGQAKRGFGRKQAESGARAGRKQARLHPFRCVPMVEYHNGQEARGDFEDVLPLIDAYDRLSSDRLNDRAQFADAMLVLTGVMGLGTADDPEDHQAAMRRLRQNRTLTLPDGDARAEWLVKNPLEKDIDVLRRALAQDIHKFSMTPDFSDERFAGNASGIAIRYKLFCLEQKTRLKERWFVAGLRERARITAGWMRKQGLPPIDPERLRIHLARETYQDDNGKETHGTSTADPPGKPGAAGDPGPDR